MIAFRVRNRAGSYGIDAPMVPSLMGAGGVAGLVLAGIWMIAEPQSPGPWWLGAYSLIPLAAMAIFLHATLRGKFIIWRQLITELALRGDETTLDIGCGRGLVVLEVARHLHAGRALGIDLWRSVDQSGNHQDATLANAQAEGVAGLVELRTGDMRQLPFDDASFDLVTASLAIHNLDAAADRRLAVVAAARVVRPGGRLLLADIRHTRDYAATLRELGWTNVSHRSLGWRYWYGGPMWATYLVRASKPL